MISTIFIRYISYFMTPFMKYILYLSSGKFGGLSFKEIISIYYSVIYSPIIKVL